MAAVDGGDGVPVDPRQRGPIADADRRLDVRSEIAAGQEGAVADDQARRSLLIVDARSCGAQRGDEQCGAVLRCPAVSIPGQTPLARLLLQAS